MHLWAMLGRGRQPRHDRRSNKLANSGESQAATGRTPTTSHLPRSRLPLITLPTGGGAPPSSASRFSIQARAAGFRSKVLFSRKTCRPSRKIEICAIYAFEPFLRTRSVTVPILQHSEKL